MRVTRKLQKKRKKEREDRMEAKELVGKRVKDNDNEYKGDTGKVSDIRTFKKANKTYAVVEWDKQSKHDKLNKRGKCYRNYSPSEFGGMFKRFKVL